MDDLEDCCAACDNLKKNGYCPIHEGYPDDDYRCDHYSPAEPND